MPLGALAPLGRSQPATSPDSHTLDASASFDFEKILGGLDKPAGDDSPKKERKKSSKTSRDSTRDGARRTASSSRDKPKPKSHSLPPALDISSDFDFEKAKNTDLADLGDSFSNLLGDVTKMSGSTKSAFGGGGRQAASIAKKEKPAPAPASRSPPAAKPKSPAASPQRASPTQPLGRKGAAFGGDRGFSLSPTDASAAPSKAAAAPASKKKAESFFSDDDVDGLLPGSEDDYAKKPEAKTAGGFGRRPSMADDAAAARGAAGDARAASAGPAALFGGASFYGGAARPATGAAPDAAQGDAPTNVPSFLGAGGARPRRNLGSRRASTGASTCGAPAGDAFGLGAPAKQAADLFALNSSDDDDKPFAKAAFVAKDPFADLSAAKMASTPAPRPAAAIEPPPPPPGCMAAATPADKPAWMSATAPAGLQPASAALPAALATAQTAPPATTASLARGGRRGSAPAQYAAPAALYAAPQAAPYPGQAAAGQSAGQAAAGLLSDLSVHLSTPAAEPEAPQADARRSVPIWMTQKPGPEDDDAVQLGGSTVAPTPMAAPGPPRPAVTPCDALPQAAAAAPQQQPSPTQRTSGAADSSQQWQLPQPPQPQSAPRHDGAPKGAAPSGPPSEVRAAPAQSSGPPFADAAVLAEASALISSLKDTVAGAESGIPSRPERMALDKYP
ncbi:hypothetical protein M885DRAFT_333007 [Pelagophyceae sp. CCMP2097]|nr:hypothetical protein M885DRAFT_333007 [Pelagophyceae sp. CCMP2097]